MMISSCLFTSSGRGLKLVRVLFMALRRAAAAAGGAARRLAGRRDGGVAVWAPDAAHLAERCPSGRVQAAAAR